MALKTYTLDYSKIADYTKRQDNRSLKVLVISASISFLLLLSSTRQKNAPPDLIYIILISMLLTGLLIGLIYMNSKKLTRLAAENLQIKVDDNSISRIIDLDNDPRLNFLHRIAYDRVKHSSSVYFAKINFNNIKSVEKKNGDLWVKDTNSNSFTGKNIVIIPRELANFDELEMEINNRRKK